MRYLLQNCLSNDLQPRIKYIYDSLCLWCTITTCSHGFIHLQSIPSNCLDILFIVGHNYCIKEYIDNHHIPEKTIVAITCDGTVRFSSLKLPNKVLYIPRQNNFNYADLLKGSAFDFNFDLTESEIIFYNSKRNKDLFQRLDKAFCKV